MNGNREELFDAYLRDRLTPEQVSELEKLLAGDDEAGREFVQHCIETGLLVRVGSRLQVAEQLGDVWSDAPGSIAGAGACAGPAQALWNRWVRRIMSVAAGLLLLGAGLVGARYACSIAVLASANGEVYITSGQETRRAARGMWLFSDMEIVVVGAGSEAMIVWKDGSSMRLPGDGDMIIAEERGQKRIRLVKGLFEADFRKQQLGKPALVTGPFVNAEILGTSIRMDTRREDGTQFSVIEGSVKVTRQTDNRAVLVTSREEVKAGNNTGVLEPQRFLWADRYSGGSQAGTAVGRGSLERK